MFFFREHGFLLADDAGDAVEAFSLTVSTFYGICAFVIHPFRNPAFHAVGKRRGFHKLPANPELPAVDAEPAVFEWLLLLRQALDFATGCRQDTVFFRGHDSVFSVCRPDI